MQFLDNLKLNNFETKQAYYLQFVFSASGSFSTAKYKLAWRNHEKHQSFSWLISWLRFHQAFIILKSYFFNQMFLSLKGQGYDIYDNIIDCGLFSKLLSRISILQLGERNSLAFHEWLMKTFFPSHAFHNEIEGPKLTFWQWKQARKEKEE